MKCSYDTIPMTNIQCKPISNYVKVYKYNIIYNRVKKWAIKNDKIDLFNKSGIDFFINYYPFRNRNKLISITWDNNKTFYKFNYYI